jgi:hypothetical protein
MATTAKLCPAMTRTGPNDASCVVWANSKFFFFRGLKVLTTITTIFRYYSRSKGTRWLREGGDDENEPKRCGMHRLAHQ